ncbi:hypothetical protein ACOMHN_017805 [Nucella lapillus]
MEQLAAAQNAYEQRRQTPSYRDNRRYSNDANSNRGDPNSNRGHVNNTDNRKNVKEHRNGRHYDDFDDRTYSQVVREVPSSNKPQSDSRGQASLQVDILIISRCNDRGNIFPCAATADQMGGHNRNNSAC